MNIGSLLHVGIVSNKHISDYDDSLYSFTAVNDEIIDFTEIWNKYHAENERKKVASSNSLFIDVPDTDIAILPMVKNQATGEMMAVDGFLIPIPGGVPNSLEVGYKFDGFQFIGAPAGLEYRFIASLY